eukprot:6182933-Pleurochrysis_carterae.AAC.3
MTFERAAAATRKEALPGRKADRKGQRCSDRKLIVSIVMPAKKSACVLVLLLQSATAASHGPGSIDFSHCSALKDSS